LLRQLVSLKRSFPPPVKGKFADTDASSGVKREDEQRRQATIRRKLALLILGIVLTVPTAIL
jgi:hypothetical protein